MRGILLLISHEDAEGGESRLSTTPMDLLADTDAEQPRYDTTLEEALEHLKGHERANIQFDLDSAAGEAEAGEVTMLRQNLAEVDALTWPSQPNAQGHYALDSVWCMGLEEDGMQYRFVPISI